MAYPDSILLIGVRADQPAATDVAPGTLYSVSDESNLVEQSDGATWYTYAGAGGGGALAVGVSTGGNTAGDTGVFTGRVVLVGSNNITLSGSSNAGSATFSILGGAGGSINLSAGTTSQNLTNFVLSNSNGVSFGLNGSTVTASHNGLTSQSNQALSAGNGSFTFQTAMFSDANGISFSTSAGSAIFASHNALTSQSNQALSGSNGSFTFQTATFGNLNGLSHYTSNGSLVGSYTAPVVSNAIQAVGSATGSGTNTSRFAADDHVHEGVFSVGVSSDGNTIGDTRVGPGRYVFEGGNNITLSQITGANAVNTILISGANAGGAQTGISGIIASDATYTSGSVYFSNQANVTIGSSVDGASQYVRLSVHAPQTGISGVVASDATYTSGSIYFSNQANVTIGSSVDGASQYVRLSVHAPQTGISWIVASDATYTSGSVYFSNQAGVTIGTSVDGASQYVRLSVAAAGAAAASAANGSFTFNTLSFSNLNGISFGTSAGSAITASHNALTSQSNQNVTAGNGGFAFQTLSFSNANNFTFATSAGSAIVGSYTVPTVPAQLSVGNSNLGNTAGDTGVFTGRMVLVGSNNITLSGSSNAGSVTLSILGGAGGGSINLSAGTTSQNLTNFVLSNSNGVSFGLNGSTVTAGLHTFSGFAPYEKLMPVTTTYGNGQMMFDVVWVPNVQFDRVAVPVFISNTTNQSGSQTASFSVGVYTRNVSTLSLVVSASDSIAMTQSGTVGSYSLFSGFRLVTVPVTTTLLAGEYVFAFGSSTASAGAVGATIAIMGNVRSSAINTFNGLFGSPTDASMQTYLGIGSYSSTTNAVPDSIPYASIIGTNPNAMRSPMIAFMSGTA